MFRNQVLRLSNISNVSVSFKYQLQRLYQECVRLVSLNQILAAASIRFLKLFLGAKQFAFMTSQMGQSHLRTSFYVSMMLQMYQFHLGNSWDVSAMPLVSYSSLTYQLLHLYDL